MSDWLYSFESDNDDIDIDVRDSVTISDDTAVDDAFDDSETVDVHPDTKETAHNEAASAGGIATGSNQDQLEMDPVAATESFIRRWFGLSREEMDEVVDESIKEAEAVAEAEEGTGDPDLDETTVVDGELDADEPDLGEEFGNPDLSADVCEGDDCDSGDSSDDGDESTESNDDDEGEEDDSDAESEESFWF